MHLRQSIKLVILFALIFLETKAQENTSAIQKIIETQINRVNSIHPSDTSYSDLHSLKASIGDAQVVLLGEQDHGDAATFQAKTRLIKFLHKECGFEVLAFESDFYSINALNFNSHLRAVDVKTLCGKRNVYPIWTNCEQNEDLFSYLSTGLTTQKPLVITGFDCRHTGGYARDNYVRQLDSLMRANNLPFQKSTHYAEFMEVLADLIDKEYKSKIALVNQQKFIQHLDTIRMQWQQVNFKANDFWTQELKNLKVFAQNSWLSKDLFNGYSTNIRDVQMSDNLLWLLNNQFAGKKVIVWAHNFHISDNINQTEANTKKEILTMGGGLKKALKDKVYILGFDSYQGTAGSIGTKPYKIRKPSANSLEQYINQKNYDYAFINLKTTAIDRTATFKMKAYLHREINGRWLNVFDGIFYIKTMYPCHYTDFD
ncbi:MAG TPA: erythromycin esterase family protein [Bacteroidia bacterium]|nr:erythromycin esterase family protein [Bacteroidia bacterium]